MYPAQTTRNLAVLAEQCYASAYEALGQGDDSNAARLFALMAMLAPRDERAWVGLAVTRERQGDLEAAAGLFGVGAALAPRKGWCELGRARTLRSMGRTWQAERALDAADACAEDPALCRAIAEERRSP